ATATAWEDEETAARHPQLAALAARLPALEPLRQRLERALDADGRVKDGAAPGLARARRAVAEGERELSQRLDRWAKGFGENAYAPRHGDRFVALVPAAGFPRRRGIVHDVSGSGQSLFVEPFEACDDNNRLLSLRAEADEEERRVLRELAGAVIDERD